MTTIPDEQRLALDQLQAQLNLILEQTGRLIAAASNGSSTDPVAQATRLKRELPGANARFQHALDRLEDELHTARLVMRRDLAVCKERVGPTLTSTAASNQTVSKAKEDPPSTQDVPDDIKLGNSQNLDIKPDLGNDTVMLDDHPNPTPDIVPPTSTSTIKQDTSSGKPALSDSKPNHHSPPLHVDTTQNPAPSNLPSATDDLNTGNATNADMDSLFNDPLSAGPDNPNAPANPAADTTFDFPAPSNSPFPASAAQDVDFSAFSSTFDAGGDNENLSSLIPGLEDYANTNGSLPGGGAGDENPDFSAFFADLGGDAGSGDAVSQGVNQQGSNGEAGNAFDDFMQYDFTALTGEEGDTQDQEPMDFEALIS